ncbi:hypothetical protein IWW45_009384 [Coemansia sp. RSA 485]|nr:hypothetical protein IWW45_009384 [Coemansia sp. RSA 485]
MQVAIRAQGMSLDVCAWLPSKCKNSHLEPAATDSIWQQLAPTSSRKDALCACALQLGFGILSPSK